MTALSNPHQFNYSPTDNPKQLIYFFILLYVYTRQQKIERFKRPYPQKNAQASKC